MLKIESIKLIQFRNCHEAHYSFNGSVTAICGKNGAGKTNLLDAVHFLCFTKSYFNQTDIQSVEQGSQGFNITGLFSRNGENAEVAVILRETNRKELWMNKEQISPFSKHIGKLPVVFIAPDDVVLINGASDERRKLVDTVLSQLDPEYLLQLIRYNKCLQERNKYLKNLSHPASCDNMLLDSFDEQLATLGAALLNKRHAFFAIFIPMVDDLFENISGGMENPELTFVPSVSEGNYLDTLKITRNKDLLLQRTTAGVHRDDLAFALKGNPFKQVASQGQKKSLLFSLKLAEFQMLKTHFGFEPILMLDDIFEKLDQQRLHRLLDWVCVKNKGQVLMTDTHEDRIASAMRDISVSFQMLKMS